MRSTLLRCVVAVLVCAGCDYGKGKQRLVLYCAHDREFSEQIISDFQLAHGLQIVTRFDTEANKSVGLYQELLREAQQPRCDVHWNNEILATLRLQQAGVLEPYTSASGAGYPARWKAADHRWHAFAARARVLLVNTRLVAAAEQPRSLLDLTQPRWRGQIAMAKPQFGTTATHAACLFQAWGRDKAQQFFRALKANEVHLVAGNKQVAEGVGRGHFAFGVTDTDDAEAEVRAGQSVRIVFPDRDGFGTLFIPNTVALIRGAPNAAGGRQLIDYLLSAAVEARLAQSASRQIPLQPDAYKLLPAALDVPRLEHAMQVDFARAAELWDEVQTFLKAEFAR